MPLWSSSKKDLRFEMGFEIDESRFGIGVDGSESGVER
jgi:hypothetical protein